MGRIRQGWELTKKSWALLREHRELFRFPIYGFAAVAVVLLVTVLPGAYLIDTQEEIPGGALLVIGLYVSTVIGLFFSVGLAATADAIFHGREATVADGMAVARERFGKILGWAAVSTTVGVISAALESTGEIGAQIVGRLLNGAWSLITFLAVPVIAIEGTGPFETLRRSASLFRTRWAGQITGNLAIGGIVFLIGMLPALLIGGAGVFLLLQEGGGGERAAGAVLVGVGVLLFAASALVMRALNGVFGVALYRYAAEGETTATFTAAELESAVKQKG
jgi:hypothetical protein